MEKIYKKTWFLLIPLSVMLFILIFYQGSDVVEGFPEPRFADQTYQSETELMVQYNWNFASAENGLPLSYKAAIRLWGWKEVDAMGYMTTYEKSGQRVQVLSDTSFLSIHSEPFTIDEDRFVYVDEWGGESQEDDYFHYFILTVDELREEASILERIEVGKAEWGTLQFFTGGELDNNDGDSWEPLSLPIELEEGGIYPMMFTSEEDDYIEKAITEGVHLYFNDYHYEFSW